MTTLSLPLSRSSRSLVFGGNGLLWLALLPTFTATVIVRRLAAGAVDPDYWWHLATGRWMLDHGRIPTTDPFSISHAGQSWYAHEWLAELVIAAVDRVGGYAAVIALTAAIAGAGVFLLWRAARYYGLAAGTAAWLVAAATFLIAGYYTVRPQVWGFTLFALLLHELAAHDTGNRKRLWLLPVVFALWVNIHLTVLLGGLTLALYILHGALRWLVSEGKHCAREFAQLSHVLMVGIVSALALCLNPRGPALLWFIRAYANPHAVRVRVIQEWQPLPFSGFNLVLFAAGGIALISVALAMVRRRALWPGVLVLLFAVAAARSARCVPLFDISAVVALGWAYGRQLPGSVALRRVRLSPHFAAAIAAATCTVALIAALGAGSIQFRRTPDPRPGNFPVDAASWLHANLPDARLFNEYTWGGYLLYSFAPQRAVYIDGREEMYGDPFFGDFVQTLKTQQGWQNTLASANVNAVIIDPKWPLASALSKDPGWQRVSIGGTAALFVSRTP